MAQRRTIVKEPRVCKADRRSSVKVFAASFHRVQGRSARLDQFASRSVPFPPTTLLWQLKHSKVPRKSCTYSLSIRSRFHTLCCRCFIQPNGHRTEVTTHHGKMPDLIDLPLDIKTLIVGHLNRYADKKALYSTCKDLYGAVIPTVYNAVDLLEDIPIAKLCSFLNLDNPGLGYVRHIRILPNDAKDKAEDRAQYKNVLSMLANQLPKDILLSFRYVYLPPLTSLVREQRLTVRKVRYAEPCGVFNCETTAQKTTTSTDAALPDRFDGLGPEEATRNQDKRYNDSPDSHHSGTRTRWC